MERREDQEHTDSSPVRPTLRGYDPKVHVQATKTSQKINDMAAISAQSRGRVMGDRFFFTVTTINFTTLYVFLVLDHGRREVMHFAVTRHPYMNWVIQQLRESMPFGRQPKYLFRDNDGIYGNGIRAFLDRCGIEEVRTAYRSPWQNPFVERFIGTLRREMLDHVIVLSQSHLERLLREFIKEYYHVARPHQGLVGDTPIIQTKPPESSGPSRLISIPILGGLHHRYVRVAA